MARTKARFFDPATERYLIEALRGGDEQAFKIIYTTYRKPLIRHAMNFTHSRARAEDVVQDVCFKVWKDRATLKVRISLTGYLFTAVRNRTYDLGRQDARLVMESLPNDEDELAALGFAHEDAEEEVRCQDFLRVVTTVVIALTPQVQRVFILSWDDDITYEQIATQLCLSVSTVRQHLMNARNQCWEALIRAGVVEEYQRQRGYHATTRHSAVEREVAIPLYREPFDMGPSTIYTKYTNNDRNWQPLNSLIDRFLTRPF